MGKREPSSERLGTARKDELDNEVYRGSFVEGSTDKQTPGCRDDRHMERNRGPANGVKTEGDLQTGMICTMAGV